MLRRTFSVVPAVTAFVLLCLPGIASGQGDRGASVAADVSATNMESRTALSFSGAFVYRFSRVAGLELETTIVPTLKSEFPGVTIQNPVAGVSSGSGIAGELQYVIYPPPSFQNQRGRAVVFSNNVRISIPTTSSRLEPFFVAGGGIASMRHTADHVYSFPRLPVPLGGSISPIPPLTTISQRVSSSSVGLALTLGGGLSVRVASQMAIEADLRLFRIPLATRTATRVASASACAIGSRHEVRSSGLGSWLGTHADLAASFIRV